MNMRETSEALSPEVIERARRRVSADPGWNPPLWYWDRNRPEAIVARAQMEESHKRIQAQQRQRSVAQEAQVILENSAARHFLLGAKHLCLAIYSAWRGLRNSATQIRLREVEEQTKRCA
jgi:hypothetical protein